MGTIFKVNKTQSRGTTSRCLPGSLPVIRKQMMGPKTLGKSYTGDVRTLCQRTTEIWESIKNRSMLCQG